MSDDQRIDLQRWLDVSAFPSSLDSPPPSIDVAVEFGAESRPASLHTSNGDHYLVLRVGRREDTLLTNLPEGDVPKQFDEYGYGMVVADGSGHAAHLSSRIAVAALVELALTLGKWNVRINQPVAEEVHDRAERFYRTIDRTLLRASHDRLYGLQSTMTAAYTAGDEMFVAHVGHSRAYLFRNDRLMRITQDQKAEHYGSSEPMPRTLGASDPIRPYVNIERVALQDGDIVLLCTNGLTAVVDDARVAATLRSRQQPDQHCRALLDTASALGARDDLTVVVAHYRIRARSAGDSGT